MNNFKNKNFTFKRRIFYLFIFTVDFIIWLFLKYLPNSYVLSLSKVKFYPIPFLKSKNRIRFRNRLKNHLLFKQYNDPKYSSCLSLTLTGKLFCDLSSIKNEVHVGMLIYSESRKIPHSWLVDPIDNVEITTKLVNGAINILELYKF